MQDAATARNDGLRTWWFRKLVDLMIRREKMGKKNKQISLGVFYQMLRDSIRKPIKKQGSFYAVAFTKDNCLVPIARLIDRK